MRTDNRAKDISIGMRGGIPGIAAVLMMVCPLVSAGSAVQARPLSASRSLDASFNMDGILTTTFSGGS